MKLLNKEEELENERNMKIFFKDEIEKLYSEFVELDKRY
jgi:hypothetical protein